MGQNAKMVVIAGKRSFFPFFPFFPFSKKKKKRKKKKKKEKKGKKEQKGKFIFRKSFLGQKIFL